MSKIESMIFAMLLLLALIIEGTLSSLPLTFIVLLTFLILKRDPNIFYIAFIAGIILDLLSVRPLGVTSAYLLVIFFAVFLYERKFETKSLPFVALASFFGSLGFLFITSFSSIIILQAIVSSILGVFLYKLLNEFFPRSGILLRRNNL